MPNITIYLPRETYLKLREHSNKSHEIQEALEEYWKNKGSG